MLADVPRLIFRVFTRKKASLTEEPFSKAHRHEKHSKLRISSQTLSQNAFYFLSFIIIYCTDKDVGVLILAVTYLIMNVLRIRFLIKTGNAYVTSPDGHNINDFIIKPFRLIVLLYLAYKLKQPIWMLGFAIFFVKWILIRPYDEFFDIPNWFHFVLVACSAVLVLSVYPFHFFGVIAPDTLKTALTTISAVYVSYVGLLGIFLGIITSENQHDNAIRKYFIQGFILNISYVSLLVLLCMVGILVYGSDSINLNSEYLFKTNLSLSLLDSKQYLFNVIFSLSWFIIFFFTMTGIVMLLKIGKMIPDFMKKK